MKIESKRRVVVTGMAGITALGSNWETISSHLKAGKTAIQYMGNWDEYEGLRTKLGAPILDFSLPDTYSRRKIRSMGRVSLLATRATELALEKAGLLNSPILTNGMTGIAFGSCTGSTAAISDFASMLIDKDTRHIDATTYVKMMPHTAAVNVGLFFELRGRVIPTSSACTSGSQAIGYAYETILNGYQSVMIAGGAEELCPSEAAVFDTLFATTQMNDTPHLSPAPFDESRDGLVIGEGASTLILEELSHAQARGADIYAEIIGFSTNCDASHITQPREETIQVCMESALEQAGLTPSQIGYISAHGTATDRGDIAESNATAKVFGNQTPISSLKSYFGHTLGACGAIESWLSIEMMNEGWFAPTINLKNPDPKCGDLDYILDSSENKGRFLNTDYIQSNNFAFGGINTALIFQRWDK